nr:hypothetical protein [Tanacetum cinerariifolium]
MMVQAREEMGEGLANPTDPHYTPIIIQPSTSQPQKTKQHRKPRRKITKVPQPSDPTEHVANEAAKKKMDGSVETAATTATILDAEQDRDNIFMTQSKATPNEPGLKEYLKFLMIHCSQELTHLEVTTQALEIDSLKKRVKKLKSRKRSRTHGLKRLYKVKLSTSMESSEDEGLGEEDASKQGRIADIDANEDIYLVNVHYDEDMFSVNELDGDEVIVESVHVAEQAKEVVDDITLAKALMETKSAKPKADKVVIQEPEQGTTTTTPTTIIANISRSKAKGLVIHEQEQAPTSIVSSQQPSQVKDKGKGKIVIPKPIKKLSKKDQLMLDEELAFKLQAEEEEKEEERLAKEKKKRRKFFAAKRAKEKRSRPLTRAQQRSIMCTYLKNIEGWKFKSLKNKSFDNIQEMFDKPMKSVNTFVDYRTKEDDVETLWILVKDKHGSTRPDGDYERVLWGDLKVMFEPHIEDEVWKMEQRYKVGRKIHDIDADEDNTLGNDQDDAEMFDVNDLHSEEVFVKNEVVDKEVNDEVQKVVEEVVEDINTAKLLLMLHKLVMLVKLMLLALRQLTKACKRERTQKELEANIALIETYDDVQAKIDVDYQMAKRLQVKEQKELTDKEKATLFMQLLEKRRKFFGAKIVEEKGKEELLSNYRADGESKMCMFFNRMLKEFDREYLEDLYNLVKAKYGSTRPVEDLDLLLWVDPKTMYEPHVEDQPNNTTTTNNNQRISSNACYSQIAQSGMNIDQDRQMLMVDDNVGNPFRENANGLSGVPRIANQHRNGNVVASRAEGNSNEINGNQIRCYNCIGEGLYASNCTVKPKKRDTAYLQTQLQIAQKDEAGIQINYEEFDFMAAAGAYDEIEKVIANSEVHHSKNCFENDIFNMFTQEEQYTELLEPIPEPHQVQQNDSNVISAVSSMEQKADESLAKHKALELEIKHLLRAVVSQDIMSVVQNPSVVDSSNLQTELERKPPFSSRPKWYVVTLIPKSKAIHKIDESHALSKPVTSNSVPTLTESKVMKNDIVISPGIFMMNPCKASRGELFGNSGNTQCVSNDFSDIQNQRHLPRNTLLDRVEVLGIIEKASRENKGIVPTEDGASAGTNPTRY